MPNHEDGSSKRRYRFGEANSLLSGPIEIIYLEQSIRAIRAIITHRALLTAPAKKFRGASEKRAEMCRMSTLKQRARVVPVA